MESPCKTASLKKFEFLCPFSKALRKLNHVLLWILSIDTRPLQCSFCAEQRKFQWLSMFCLYTLPLVRSAQAKIQICSIVKLVPWNEVNLSHLYLSCLVQHPINHKSINWEYVSSLSLWIWFWMDVESRSLEFLKIGKWKDSDSNTI